MCRDVEKQNLPLAAKLLCNCSHCSVLNVQKCVVNTSGKMTAHGSIQLQLLGFTAVQLNITLWQKMVSCMDCLFQQRRLKKFISPHCFILIIGTGGRKRRVGVRWESRQIAKEKQNVPLSGSDMVDNSTKGKIFKSSSQTYFSLLPLSVLPYESDKQNTKHTFSIICNCSGFSPVCVVDQLEVICIGMRHQFWINGILQTEFLCYTELRITYSDCAVNFHERMHLKKGSLFMCNAVLKWLEMQHQGHFLSS